MISFNSGIGNLEKDKLWSQDSSDMLLHEPPSASESRTWQQTSLLESLTIIRYLGVLYLFLSCTTRRFRAK